MTANSTLLLTNQASHTTEATDNTVIIFQCPRSSFLTLLTAPFINIRGIGTIHCIQGYQSPYRKNPKLFPDFSWQNCRQYVEQRHIYWSKFSVNTTYEKITVRIKLYDISYMMIRESVHTVVTVFLPHHSLVTSILLSCHNQIFLTIQIPQTFPDFGPLSWLHWPSPNSLTFPGFQKYQKSGNPAHSWSLALTSVGSVNDADCWNGQDPELNTMILKSTAIQTTAKPLQAAADIETACSFVRLTAWTI